MLTGVCPMYDTCSEKDAANQIRDGHEPFLHPSWAEHSFAEGQLVHVIQDCLAYDPQDRLSITELVQRLRWAVRENRRQTSQWDN